MSGQLSTEIIAQSGIVRVAGSGLWTPEQARAHFRDLHQLILRLRAGGGAVLVLVDLSRAAVQTAETARIIQEATSQIYRDADRVAVVCATRLLAMQIKRAAQIKHLSTFEDVATAQRWLGGA